MSSAEAAYAALKAREGTEQGHGELSARDSRVSTSS